MRRNMHVLVLPVLIGLAMAVPARSARSTAPEPVSILIHDFSTSENTAVGTFETSGAIETSGQESQVIGFAGMSLHCEHTLTAPEGTITIRSDCNMNTLDVNWRVIGATGAFSGLKAHGGGFMEFTDNPLEAFEHFNGNVY